MPSSGSCGHQSYGLFGGRVECGPRFTAFSLNKCTIYEHLVFIKLLFQINRLRFFHDFSLLYRFAVITRTI